MHHSKRNSIFPLWLACLLLFAVLVAFFVLRLPRIMTERTPEEASPLPVLTSEEGVTEDDSASASLVVDPESVIPPEEDGVKNGDAALITAEPESESEPYTELVVETSEEPEVHIHSYRNGVCAECGAKPEFLTGFLPDEFYQENEHAGTVSLHRYKITAYANYGNGEYDRCFNVYLPYGYDETKPYDVLVLVHGYGGDQDSWLNTVYDYGDIQMCGRVIFDNIFDKGLARPCIIVGAVSETNQCQGLTAGINQLKEELRTYILPYIVEHYSTYAEDSSIEGIRAARDHFGIGGLSNGALFVYEGGMRYDFDLFSSFAAFSGNGEPWKTVSLIQDEQFADLPIRCLFTGAGTQDLSQQHYTEIGYEYFLENEPRVEEGKNAWRVDVEGEHEWKVWFTDMYNALPLMFQQTD